MKTVNFRNLVLMLLTVSLAGGWLTACSGKKSGNKINPAGSHVRGDDVPTYSEPVAEESSSREQEEEEPSADEEDSLDEIRVELKEGGFVGETTIGPQVATLPTQQVGTPPSQPVTTGAVDEAGRRFIDIVNDGWLLQIKRQMNEEPDLSIRDLSKEFAASIRRVDVHTNLKKRDVIVRVGFSVGYQKPLVYAILRGTLGDGLSAQLVEDGRSTPDYLFKAKVDCLDRYCENTKVTLEQWADKDGDGSIEVCKRAYAIHRNGTALLTLDKQSRIRFENKQSSSTAFNRFTEFLVNTIEINEYMTQHHLSFPPTGQVPTPYADVLNLRTWTVAYGASEYLIHFERAIMGGEKEPYADKTTAFRGFLYENVNNCFGNGIPVEYGSLSTKEYEQKHIIVALPGSYAAGISSALQTHSDDQGRIILSIGYKGEPAYSVLQFESLIEPTFRPRLN